jgi:2-C-methyl-D-erythritol 4-phosphate cytidylyltransferase
VRELFKAAENAPAVIPVMPVTDTLKVLEKRGGVLAATGETVDRSRIYGAQTPQVFQSEALKAAYTLHFDTSFTDDASVAERYGLALTFLPGERFNLKITTPEDLILARAILDSLAPR